MAYNAKELSAFLPEHIETPLLIGAVVIGYKIYTFVKKKIANKKEEQKVLEEEILKKERVRSEYEARLNKVEEQIEEIKDEFKEKNFEIKKDFEKLDGKLDRILTLLIPPINSK